MRRRLFRQRLRRRRSLCGALVRCKLAGTALVAAAVDGALCFQRRRRGAAPANKHDRDGNGGGNNDNAADGAADCRGC